MEQNLLYIMIAIGAVELLLLILTIVLIFSNRKLYRAYDYFMRGRTAESLEDTIMEMGEEIEALKSEDQYNKDAIRALNKHNRASYQKMGIVKYNAFPGMGGNMSSAVAILDYTNTGLIINMVHGREGCYMYTKIIDKGRSDILLGEEETEALQQAIGYLEKPQNI